MNQKCNFDKGKVEAVKYEEWFRKKVFKNKKTGECPIRRDSD